MKIKTSKLIAHLTLTNEHNGGLTSFSHVFKTVFMERF